MGIMDFYKYIQKNECGKWEVIYKRERYGEYDDIRDALHDRDLFMSSGWDYSEAIMKDDTPNKYKNMELPPSRKYITLKRVDNREYFMIRKTINGEQKCFGHYKTFNEAAEKRDELVANNWRVE